MGCNVRIVVWFNVFSGVITYLLYHNLTFEKEQKLYWKIVRNKSNFTLTNYFT